MVLKLDIIIFTALKTLEKRNAEANDEKRSVQGHAPSFL